MSDPPYRGVDRRLVKRAGAGVTDPVRELGYGRLHCGTDFVLQRVIAPSLQSAVDRYPLIYRHPRQP